MRASQTWTGFGITADDDTLVADAGLLLPATLGRRLGLAGAARSAGAAAGRDPAEKCLTVIHSRWPVGTASTTSTRCGPGRPARCWGIGSPRRRRWDVPALAALGPRPAARRGQPAGCSAGPSRPGDPPTGRAVRRRHRLHPVRDLRAGQARRAQVMRTGRRGYHPILAVTAGTGDIAARPAAPRPHQRRLRRAGVHQGDHLPGSGLPGWPERWCCAPTPASTSPTWSPPAARRRRFSIGARMIGPDADLIAAIAEDGWTPIDYFCPAPRSPRSAGLAFDQDTRGRRGAGPQRQRSG